MSQESVFKLLESNPDKWWLLRDIREAIGVNNSSLCKSLKKLIKWKEVEVKKIENKELDTIGGRRKFTVLVYKIKGEQK